uniref:Zinc finger and BTB domain containing 41 n=1 Tax=Scleropages formosus TaxID=113540 RepID=A0A8C9RSA7_SCLFO
MKRKNLFKRRDSDGCKEKERQTEVAATSCPASAPSTDGLGGCGSPHSSNATSQQKKLLSSRQNDNNFLQFLNDDRQKTPSFCDLVVVVDGKRYSAHKVVLAFGSSYFHTRLVESPDTALLTLDHMDHSAFQHLLKFLYTSEFVISEKEIPMLVEAATLLDIRDAVRLLTSKEVPSISGQEQQAPVKEIETNPKPTEGISRTPSSSRCAHCSRTFCYRKSLENHVARRHSACESSEGRQGDSNTEVSLMARRSARRRRCPVKFEEGGAEGVVMSDKSSPSSANSEETPISAAEENGEDEEGDGEGRDVDSQSALDRGDELYEEDSDDTEKDEQNGSEAEEHSAGTDALDHVYPEGLTPVVVQIANKKILKCPKCEKTFDRAGKYESHTRVHTGEKPFQCDICQQCYSTKSNLTVHKKKHNSEIPFQKKEHKCPFCNKLHASKKTLAKHVRRFHSDQIQEFLSMKKRKSEGWKCDICHKSFTRRPHLEEHMILHSQDRPFKCTYCDDYFKSRFARLKHQEKYHLGPFPCDICGRQFNDTGNRKRHIECTHGGKRKWTCFICGKSVRERVHHDDKRYECDECGKTFIRHDHLTKHKKIHSGEKAHQCEECGKCFRRHDHLTVHYRSVHLGEKVWQKYKAALHQCEVCKKEFKGKSSLEMHFRTHSGEKPYRCPTCNQTFRIKKTLTKHMVIHSDARPFNCPHCSATFKRKDKLKYHMDHVHGTKAPEESPAGTGEEKAAGHRASYRNEVYPSEQKANIHDAPADVCVPVALVPVPMPEVTSQTGLVGPGPPLILQSQSEGQPTAEYQPPADLVFLEKYTLTPQPANIVHPVRPDQMLDPRDQSYLGTLLGLDSAAPVQNISNSDHAH